MCNYQRQQIESYFQAALDLSNDDLLSSIIEDMAAMVRLNRIEELGWMAELMDLYYENNSEAVTLVLDTIQYYISSYTAINK